MMAASENDAPKVAELLRAGASATIRVRPVRDALRPPLVDDAIQARLPASQHVWKAQVHGCPACRQSIHCCPVRAGGAWRNTILMHFLCDRGCSGDDKLLSLTVTQDA